jgi:hypothetical protein
MTNETVTLESEKWTQLLDIIARTPMAWTITNPLIQEIGRQLQLQRTGDGHGDIDSERGAKVEGSRATGIAAADTHIVRGTKRPGSS